MTMLLEQTIYEYGPFGEPVRVSGAMAGQNPFRFSTKYTDGETGLLNYIRPYGPSMGCWLNRDPIGENGGCNLFGFVGNDPIDNIDPLGMNFIAVGRRGAHIVANTQGHMSIVGMIFRRSVIILLRVTSVKVNTSMLPENSHGN